MIVAGASNGTHQKADPRFAKVALQQRHLVPRKIDKLCSLEFLDVAALLLLQYILLLLSLLLSLFTIITLLSLLLSSLLLAAFARLGPAGCRKRQHLCGDDRAVRPTLSLSIYIYIYTFLYIN